VRGLSLDTKEKDMERIGYYLGQLALAGLVCHITLSCLFVLALNFGVI
jgi:hypothetical protein|tara:strand:- start:144 stop:287 length:144 start_codon:yes stop_codon:yes gene_type:complete